MGTLCLSLSFAEPRWGGQGAVWLTWGSQVGGLHETRSRPHGTGAVSVTQGGAELEAVMPILSPHTAFLL